MRFLKVKYGLSVNHKKTNIFTEKVKSNLMWISVIRTSSVRQTMQMTLCDTDWYLLILKTYFVIQWAEQRKEGRRQKLPQQATLSSTLVVVRESFGIMRKNLLFSIAVMSSVNIPTVPKHLSVNSTTEICWEATVKQYFFDWTLQKFDEIWYTTMVNRLSSVGKNLYNIALQHETLRPSVLHKA